MILFKRSSADATNNRVGGERSKFKSCPSMIVVVFSNILVASITWILSSRPQQALLIHISQGYLDFSSRLASTDTSTRQDDPKEGMETLDYVPSPIESYFLDHGVELGLHVERPEPSGCTEWNNQSSPIAADLAAFQAELEDYNKKMAAFPGTVKDLREHLTATDHSICDSLMLHPEGLDGIFPSGALTQTANGLIEPIFPPMRHPNYCDGRKYSMSLEYLVHDFPRYCRKLKPTSRIVLVDMGASLDFHRSGMSPAIYLTYIYQRFGFAFDHIYAYEITPKEPQKVFERLPADLYAAYHWINVGVNPEVNSTQNPWNMILNTYKEDDLIIVKLDIDHSKIEVALAQQLLQNPKLLKLIDAFYFEHHVRIAEMKRYWTSSMSGSIHDSIQLFTQLRRAGVAAHSWV